MSRPAAVLVLVLAAAAARADLAVPPPPGKKFVTVEHVITTEKGYPEQEFYLLVGSRVTKKVALGPNSPVKIDANRNNGPQGFARLVAVPKGTSDKFGDEKDFAATLRTNKVPGQVSTKQAFPRQATVDAADPRKSITETYAVERIDEKDGIVLRAAKGKDAPPAKNAAEDDAELADEPAAFAPRNGNLVAGLAAALALAFAGVWLVRRNRP